MTLSKYLTTKDVEVWVAGRKFSEGKNLDISISSEVKEVKLLNTEKTKHYRTAKRYTGSLELINTDLQNIGYVLRDLEMNPSKIDNPDTLAMAFNEAKAQISYIQGDGTTGTISIDVGQMVAQSFEAAYEELTRVKIYNPTAASTTVTVAIQADSSGSPSGTDLVSGTADFSTTGWKTVTLNYTGLTRGNKYWLVVKGQTETVNVSYSSEKWFDGWKVKVDSGAGWGTEQEKNMKIALYFEGYDTYISAVLTDGSTTVKILLDEVTFQSASIKAGHEDVHSGELEFTAKSLTVTEE